MSNIFYTYWHPNLVVSKLILQNVVEVDDSIGHFQYQTEVKKDIFGQKFFPLKIDDNICHAEIKERKLFLSTYAGCLC